MVIRTSFIGTLIGVTALLTSVTAQAIEFNQIQPDKSAVSFVFKADQKKKVGKSTSANK